MMVTSILSDIYTKYLYLFLVNNKEASATGTHISGCLNVLLMTNFSLITDNYCFNCNGLIEWDVMSARVDDAARTLISG